MSDSDDNIEQDWDNFMAVAETKSATSISRPHSLSPDPEQWQQLVDLMVTPDVAHQSPHSTPRSDSEPEASLEPTANGNDDEYRPPSVPDPARHSADEDGDFLNTIGDLS